APIPGVGTPTPGVVPASYTPPSGGSGYSLPTRALRTVPTAAGVNPSAAPNYGGVPVLPTYSTAQSQAQLAAQQAAVQQATISPYQQIVLMEAQREANKANPKFPPLPPTALTPQNENPTTTPTTNPRIPPPRLPGMPQLPQ